MGLEMCKECGGKGYVKGEACKNCKGAGTLVPKPKK
jgi:DnaJ-class molecular chaperone